MRLVMFDLDGTLVDSGAIIFEHMSATFRAHGLAELTPAQSNAVIGLSLEVAMERLADVDAVTAATLAQTYRKEYRAMLAMGERHEPLYVGAGETVQRLAGREDTLLGVATGKGLQGVHRILALHGFTDHFVTLQTPDHNPSKPHPGMLLRAMEETGIAARETVMIGDTSFDMTLAKAAGTWAIGVSWGYHARVELEAAGADLIVEDYALLEAAIERILS